VNGIEIARYASAHLDGVDRDEAADVLVAVGDQSLGRLGDGYLRGRWRSGLGTWLALAAASEPEPRQQQEQHGRQARGPEKLGYGHEIPVMIWMVRCSKYGRWPHAASEALAMT